MLLKEPCTTHILMVSIPPIDGKFGDGRSYCFTNMHYIYKDTYTYTVYIHIYIYIFIYTSIVDCQLPLNAIKLHFVNSFTMFNPYC